MNNNEIIDWLVQNKPLIYDVIEKVVNRRVDAHALFQEEANVQFNVEVKNEILDQLTRDLGCTVEDFHDKISESMFNDYLKEIIK